MIASDTVWGKVIPDKFAQKLMERAGYDDNNRIPPGVGQEVGQVIHFGRQLEIVGGERIGYVLLDCGHSYNYRTRSDAAFHGMRNSGISIFNCPKCPGGAA